MPGPAPIPRELKRARGNPGHQKLPQPKLLLPAVPEGMMPEPPASLGWDGLAAWNRYWSLGPAWLSPRTDIGILVRLCEAYDERVFLKETIKNEGYFTEGSTGQTVAHPAVTQLRALETLMTRWESLCGFTPTDRSRLGMAEVQRTSKLDQLRDRRERATRAA